MRTPLTHGLMLFGILAGCGSFRSDQAPEFAPAPEPAEQPAPAPQPDPAQAAISDDVACASTSDCVATQYPGCCQCSCPTAWFAWSQAWVEEQEKLCMVADCVGCVDDPISGEECPPEHPIPPTGACVEGRCVLVRG